MKVLKRAPWVNFLLFGLNLSLGLLMAKSAAANGIVIGDGVWDGSVGAAKSVGVEA